MAVRRSVAGASDDIDESVVQCSNLKDHLGEGDLPKAVLFCYMCDSYLCPVCQDKDKCNPRPVLQVTGSSQVCPIHDQELITFYCRECKEVLCKKCQLVYHR